MTPKRGTVAVQGEMIGPDSVFFCCCSLRNACFLFSLHFVSTACLCGSVLPSSVLGLYSMSVLEGGAYMYVL